MGKHRHATCAHELAFCTPCQAVYCRRCDQEWVAPCTKAHYYVQPWWGHSQPYYGTLNITTVGGTPALGNAPMRLTNHTTCHATASGE